MNTLLSMVGCFLIAATIQNLLLTAGMGTAAMLKVMRRPRQVVLFGQLLLAFSVVTTAVFYPLDKVLPVTWLFRMLRPFIIVVITAVLYIVAVVLLARLFRERYRRIRHLLPLAVFNNLVVGITLVINHQVSLGFFSALGLSAGAAVGFLVVSALTAEGVSRLDNPDIPAAFRGLPATLVYLGLLALALMGFSPVLNLI